MEVARSDETRLPAEGTPFEILNVYGGTLYDGVARGKFGKVVMNVVVGEKVVNSLNTTVNVVVEDGDCVSLVADVVSVSVSLLTTEYNAGSRAKSPITGGSFVLIPKLNTA